MPDLLRLSGPAPANADGRFAPSPTGELHVGNLRTALLAWLFARAADARFLLRVDDLDPGRSREVHVKGQLADLESLGIDWDGDVVRQSERAGLYEAALERLRGDGLIYECWCTRAEIREAASAPHAAHRAYPGTCLNLTSEERGRRAETGGPPALRVRAGAERVGFEDRLHGRVEAAVDDFVVRRGDGAHAYNLAVVVDDADQRVGEVVRGDDLLEGNATPGLAPAQARAADAELRPRAADPRGRRRAPRQAPRRGHAR